eukprot:2523396-Prymnesium_polylepis.1
MPSVAITTRDQHATSAAAADGFRPSHRSRPPHSDRSPPSSAVRLQCCRLTPTAGSRRTSRSPSASTRSRATPPL